MIPESALIEARHITITASLVRACGGMNEAAVASLIAWKTEPGAPFAEDASEDGALWWRASAEMISDWTGLSPDQVRRAIKRLLDDGHIERMKTQRNGFGDHTYTYRLVRQTDVAKSPDLDVAESPILPLYETSKRDTPIVPAGDDAFDDVWTAWPRKDGSKKLTRTKWARLSEAERNRIVPILVAHANIYRSWPDSEKKFIPYLQTWLNQERWDDTPPEPRGSRQTYAQQAQQNTIDMINRIKAQEEQHEALADGNDRGLRPLDRGSRAD